MSNIVKMTIVGKRDDLISIIDHLPLEGLKKMKVMNPAEKKKQKRVLTLNADVFNQHFNDKKRCLE